MLAHLHPIPIQFTCTLVPREHGILSSSVPGCTCRARNRRVPRAPLPGMGVTHDPDDLKVISEDITLPSQLIRTHASDRIPPSDSVFPCTLGLCRLSPVPAGKRPFPTLSLQSLHRCLDPYSVVSPECTCPLLPRKHWPHAMGYAFGTQDYPCNATSTGRSISELQSFVYLQAPMLARPPGHTHR